MVVVSEVEVRGLEQSWQNRSNEIWSAFTLLTAAESDYQSTQWTSAAHAAEAEAALRRYLNGFGQLRSQEEWEEWRRLASIVALRLNSERESQSGVADHTFNQQMKVFRSAITQTDQLEQQRAKEAVMNKRRALYLRLGVLSALGAGVLILLSWTPWRRSVRRRRTVQRLGV